MSKEKENQTTANARKEQSQTKPRRLLQQKESFHSQPALSLRVMGTPVTSHKGRCPPLGSQVVCPLRDLALDTSGPGHIRPWTHQTLDTSGPGHIRPWTYQALDTSGPGHIKLWTHQALDISGPGHIRPWTYQVLDTSGPGHIGPWTRRFVDAQGDTLGAMLACHWGCFSRAAVGLS